MITREKRLEQLKYVVDSSEHVRINSIQLDGVIWSTGRNIEGEHHLTKTIFYGIFS